jgi:hypothetical protein
MVRDERRAWAVVRGSVLPFGQWGRGPICESGDPMAKCDEGYQCDVCGQDVLEITQSDLYLRYVIGQVDPETLHTAPERHVRCNPALAQFIVDAAFEPVVVAGEFDKRTLDPLYVSQQEELMTRGWHRLCEIVDSDESIIDYPLPEVRDKIRSRYE